MGKPVVGLVTAFGRSLRVELHSVFGLAVYGELQAASLGWTRHCRVGDSFEMEVAVGTVVLSLVAGRRVVVLVVSIEVGLQPIVGLIAASEACLIVCLLLCPFVSTCPSLYQSGTRCS